MADYIKFCSRCDYGSTDSFLFTAHVLEEHLNCLPYCCSWCAGKFSIRQKMEEHLASAHGVHVENVSQFFKGNTPGLDSMPIYLTNAYYFNKAILNGEVQAPQTQEIRNKEYKVIGQNLLAMRINDLEDRQGHLAPAPPQAHLAQDMERMEVDQEEELMESD